MSSESSDKPHGLDDRRLASWLRGTTHEYDGVGELGDGIAGDPVTPPRRAALLVCCEEVSPTNTSFSGGSVFDAPRAAGGGWIEDVFCDDIPDEAPGADVWSRTDGEVKDLAVDLDGLPGTTETPRTTAPLSDPDSPRPTWLTSCLQCIQADLPCSRKAPACSRCKRNGQAALCLLHRRLYPEEISGAGATWPTALKLLKLEDEDAEIWERKLQLASEVCSLVSAAGPC